MNSKSKIAKTAGLLYLVVVFTGLFSLMYVPSELIVLENAAETYHNIKSSETLFRLGIASSLLCYTAFLFLPLVLYKLFKPLNKNVAAAMVLLAVMSVPISFVNIQNKLTVLSLFQEGIFPDTFSNDQTQSLVIFYLSQYDLGIQIASIFWGLWLFPFGYLVFKSGFLPKILGSLLMLGCFGYLINSFGNILFPDYSKTGIATYVSLPAALGEIGTCLWLLIMGVKIKSSSN